MNKKVLENIIGVIGAIIFAITSISTVLVWWQYEDAKALIPVAIATIPTIAIYLIGKKNNL